jgi:hypothetical protein
LLGYLAAQSNHSRGNADDVAITALNARQQEDRVDTPLKPCYLPLGQRSDDGSLDFGTAYDCFHELSSTNHPAVKGEARRNRDRLLAEMRSAGFTNYGREWWHFELLGAGSVVQDFPLRRPPAESAADTPSCAGDISVVCLREGATAQVYDGPGLSARPIGALRPGDTIIRCLKCQGKYSLQAFANLDARARTKEIESAPWCLVQYFGLGALQNSGWLRGENIAPNGQVVDCGSNR